MRWSEAVRIFFLLLIMTPLDLSRQVMDSIWIYFALIKAISTGSDSNGSGVAVLLELLNIFSQLYFLPSHKARYNLVFVFSAGGKFSYQGSRNFIDDFNERFSGSSIR